METFRPGHIAAPWCRMTAIPAGGLQVAAGLLFIQIVMHWPTIQTPYHFYYPCNNIAYLGRLIAEKSVNFVSWLIQGQTPTITPLALPTVSNGACPLSRSVESLHVSLINVSDINLTNFKRLMQTSQNHNYWQIPSLLDSSCTLESASIFERKSYGLALGFQSLSVRNSETSKAALPISHWRQKQVIQLS